MGGGTLASVEPEGLKLKRGLCYDQGSDFSAHLLTGYDYSTPKVSLHISHGQLFQSA